VLSLVSVVSSSFENLGQFRLLYTRLGQVRTGFRVRLGQFGPG